MKVAVLDAGTLGFDDAQWSGLADFGELHLSQHTEHSVEAAISAMGDAEIVFTNKVPISKEVFEACPKLRFIGVLATGYNIIDLQCAEDRGVAVCNVPGYSTASTAQHAVALILDLCNQVGRHSLSVHSGDWIRSRHFSYWLQSPRELSEMTVGIVGFGTIGRRVGAALHAMGARIVASARTPRDTPDYPGFAWLSTDEIFRQADLVTLHCPETPENRGFVNGALLAQMRPGALFVNTARGGLVDEMALARALETGHLGGAAVDVVRQEPMRSDCPLYKQENCIVTPHIAWAGEASRKVLILNSIENLAAFLRGEALNRVA